jgi:DNA-binding XRE family transcriptional regulator
MKLAYPMRFYPEPTTPGVYNVEGIEPMGQVLTYGESLEHAKEMARDALTGVLEVMLDNNQPIPRPPHAEGQDIVWVEPEPEVVAPILLRWAREEAKLTQGEVAARMGITQQSYQRLERSGANPSIKTLARAARALNRRLDLDIAI